MNKGPDMWTGERLKNLVWNEMPAEDWQFLAMGNGHIGITAFLPDEIVIQVNANNNWNQSGDLPGIMRIHIDFPDKPFRNSNGFNACTDLKNGLIVFETGGKNGVKVVLRVQSNMDIVIADIYDHRNNSSGVKIWIETWRDVKKYSVDNYYAVAERNENSEFKEMCSRQFMQEWAENHPDPWLGLGTAVAMDTSSMKQKDDCFFVRPDPYYQLKISVYVGYGSYEKLVSNAISVLADGSKTDRIKLESFHKSSFSNLWKNSFLKILSDDPEWKNRSNLASLAFLSCRLYIRAHGRKI